jgi:hypothetical protein
VAGARVAGKKGVGCEAGEGWTLKQAGPRNEKTRQPIGAPASRSERGAIAARKMPPEIELAAVGTLSTAGNALECRLSCLLPLLRPRWWTSQPAKEPPCPTSRSTPFVSRSAAVPHAAPDAHLVSFSTRRTDLPPCSLANCMSGGSIKHDPHYPSPLSLRQTRKVKHEHLSLAPSRLLEDT